MDFDPANPLSLTVAEKLIIQELARMPAEAIDHSDIPPISNMDCFQRIRPRPDLVHMTGIYWHGRGRLARIWKLRSTRCCVSRCESNPELMAGPQVNYIRCSGMILAYASRQDAQFSPATGNKTKLRGLF